MKTALEMAVIWGVHVRTVQKWAKEGKLLNVSKFGRNWMIPDNTPYPALQQDRTISNEQDELLAMPLMNSTFPLGTALAYIDTIKNNEVKSVAIAEYQYFCGNTQLSRTVSAKLLSSKHRSISLSAQLIHIFSNIEQGNIKEAQQNIEKLKLDAASATSSPNEVAAGILIRCLTAILLHNTEEVPTSLEEAAKFLPDGLKLFAYYSLAHLYYLKEDYSHSLGIAEAGLCMFPTVYPISFIYLNLIAAMDCMNLKDTAKGKEYFLNAWELAKYDGFLQPFGEHHGLLEGLIEVLLKKKEPEAYHKIIDITYQFSDGWRRIHNPHTCDSVTNLLTTTEFSIAMLASKKWTNRQIAQYMNLSEGTIKNQISRIYNKLNITNRGDLKKYLLK